MLVNPHDFHPEPPSDITRRLHSIRPGLTLNYSPFEKCWYVWLPWEADNPAWSRIRSGELDPTRAFDIVGRLPLDCSLEQAPALLERQLRDFPRDDVKAMANAVRDWNQPDAVAGRQIDAAVEAVMSLPDPTAAPNVKPKRTRKT